MPTQTLLFQTFLIASAVLWVTMAACACITYAKRANPSIALRCPRLLAASAAGALVVTAAITARAHARRAFPCLAFLALASTFIYAYSVPYMLRQYLLCKRWAWHSSLAYHPHSVLQKHDALCASVASAATRAALLCFAFHALLTAFSAFTLYAEHGAADALSGCELHYEFLLLLVLFVGYWTAFGYTLLRYGRMRDAFGIGAEMVVVGTGWLVFGVLFFGTNLLSALSAVADVVDPALWVYGGIAVSVFASGVVPLLFCWKHRHVFSEVDLAQRTMMDEDLEKQCTTVLFGDDGTAQKVRLEALARFDVPRLAFVTQCRALLGDQVVDEKTHWRLDDEKMNAESFAYLYAKYLHPQGPCGDTVRKGLSSATASLQALDSAMAAMTIPAGAHVADSSLLEAARDLHLQVETQALVVSIAIDLRAVVMDVLRSVKVAYIHLLTAPLRHTTRDKALYVELE